MSLSNRLIRFSIGLDNEIERTYSLMKECMLELGVLQEFKVRHAEFISASQQ